jgi:hypothetical protein
MVTLPIQRRDELTRQSIPISAGGGDEEGCLVLQDGRLVAVLVKLSALHGDLAGRWYLEAGFGLLDSPDKPDFADLSEAQDWVAERLANTRIRQSTSS